jgi:hypothetical protein
MYQNRSLVAGIVGILALAGAVTPSYAQTASTAPAGQVLGQSCNLLHDLVPPNPADPNSLDSTRLTALDAAHRKTLLTSGLPCQESVSGNGPAKTGLQNRQRGFDFYSWLTFLALNSPADGRPITQSEPDTKTKWEDRNNFMHLLDVMVEDPEHNTPEWGKRKIPQECLSQYQDKIKNINDMMVIEMIEETFNEPFKTGPLIDQQGNYALFDILMNKQIFDYMLAHKLYSKKAQEDAASAALKVDFPSGFNPDKGKTDGGDPGAVMIKVSWKVIESEKDKERFHTVDALVLMPRHEGKSEPPPCLRKTLGLVGFHVGHKTVSRRQWIWTSFEHIDNVPEDLEVASGNLKASYNFYDLNCPECETNQTPPTPWDPIYANGLKFHDSKFKSQITRVVPLTDESKGMSKQFQSILGDNVWKHYILLSTQWPSDFDCSPQGDSDSKAAAKDQPTNFKKQPDMTCGPAPTYLANSTLETYSQGKIPLASSSCIACHGNAVSHQRRAADGKPGDFFNQSDFTFMLEKAR